MGRILFEGVHHQCHHQDFSRKGLRPKRKVKLFLKANDLLKSKNKDSLLELKANLVSGDPVLLHLLKFTLQLRLSFHFFLSPANIDLFPIELLPIHLIYSLH